MGHLFNSFGLGKKPQEKEVLIAPRLVFRASTCFKAYLLWAWSELGPRLLRVHEE